MFSGQEYAGKLALIAFQRKRKASLTDLAQLIRDAYGTSQHFADHARQAAAVAIEAAVVCGGYLREAKARLPHGEFQSWVRREAGIDPRTANNYMRLHIWVCAHQAQILEAKPHSLRQFYILAGILPEDESRKLPKAKDDLAKLRRLVRRTAMEAAAHRDFSDANALLRALEPLAALLEELLAETKGKHISDFDE